MKRFPIMIDQSIFLHELLHKYGYGLQQLDRNRAQGAALPCTTFLAWIQRPARHSLSGSLSDTGAQREVHGGEEKVDREHGTRRADS